jgi:hypothetical protein
MKALLFSRGKKGAYGYCCKKNLVLPYQEAEWKLLLYFFFKKIETTAVPTIYMAK